MNWRNFLFSIFYSSWFCLGTHKRFVICYVLYHHSFSSSYDFWQTLSLMHKLIQIQVWMWNLYLCFNILGELQAFYSLYYLYAFEHHFFSAGILVNISHGKSQFSWWNLTILTLNLSSLAALWIVKSWLWLSFCMASFIIWRPRCIGWRGCLLRYTLSPNLWIRKELLKQTELLKHQSDIRIMGRKVAPSSHTKG